MLGVVQLGRRQLHAARFNPRIMTTMNALRPPHPKWKDAAPFPPKGTVTFAHQDKLPRLPVLPLQPTLDKLKSSLRALAWSDDEYEAAARKIDEFGASGAIGETLQTRLNQWAKGKDHWLEEWWDDAGYLKYRESVVVNVSYYCALQFSPCAKLTLSQTVSPRIQRICHRHLPIVQPP